MSSLNPTVVVQRGLKCPKCGTLGEVGDAACISGDFDFSDDHEVVGVNDEGEVIEVNGQPVSAANPRTPATAAIPTGSPTGIAVPAAAADSSLSAVSGADSSAVTAGGAAASGSTQAPNKKCWLELRVDTSARDGRPPAGDADYDEPPTWAPFRFELSAPLVRFGRAPVIPSALTIDGDKVVSRVHGDLRRMPNGTYELENLSNNCTFVRGLAKLLKAGDRHILAPGEELEVGDWVTITYCEDAA